MNLRVYRTMFANSIQQVLIYRTTSILIIVFGLLFYIIEMFAGVIYFNYTDNILGWTKWDYFSLVTTASIIQYSYNLIFIWGVSNLSNTIIDGNLDYIILRPLNSFWYYALYRTDFPSIVNIVLGIAVQGWIISKRNSSLIQILLYILFVLMGIWFIFLINYLLVMVSFWKEKSDALVWIPETLMENSTRPAAIYPKWLQFLLMWVLPTLTAINLPVDIIRGKVNITNMFWYVIFIIIFTIVTYKIWHVGLKKYQSSN
ncbi:MAG: ABC-2 family transporter protein [Leptotrichiaceae bacterium]|nr:ABC-2 family transporter protein [Leptotrichiaceae bacterium]